jgi:sialate O-acetylesterase
MKMKTNPIALISMVALGLGLSLARADVRPNPLFADHAVLQQGMKVPVWGTAAAGEKVTVEFDGQSVSTTAGSDGKWIVRLAPLKLGAPRTLTISGKNRIVLNNVQVGEVWVCSGQSNMERQLGLRAGQQPITGWEKEVAAAKYPDIRHFGVAQKQSLTPLQTVKGEWAVCSPETVINFTAVGYFFGRDLFQARHVPVGLIHASWGGTPAEAWSSEAALSSLPDFAESLVRMKRFMADPAGVERETLAKQKEWYERVDPGSRAASNWSAADWDVSDWKRMTLPALWESAGHPDFNGVFWFRRSLDLPENWNGSDVELHLGPIDDNDTTWVNGTQVGATTGWDTPRVYRVPAGLLKRSNNSIVVRVLDTGGGGGIWPGNDAMRVSFTADGKTSSVPLSGEWLCKPGVPLATSGWPPVDFQANPSAPTVLYNGMIAPLLPYAIRGAIWYQGEANSPRARQYQTLFPAMIAGWRKAWDQGDFPFLFVQIAPNWEMTPEIREAQLLSWQKTRNTAMAVTIDCGDAKDIHPANKEPVGARLALAARALAYGEEIEFSGPVFDSMRTKGTNAILRFTHHGGGLVARDGALKGFTIAGADKVFHPAKAEIAGDTVVVASPEVPEPIAVRYGWANVPEGNLFNQAGLPATPFRTDVE